MNQHELTVHTQGRGLTDITARVADLVDTPGGDCGLVHIFIHHTSASLIIQENADPDVRRDLDAFFARLVPDGDPIFTHIEEGPDDMSAHIRSVLTAIPRCPSPRDGLPSVLQGIYLWEHRTQPYGQITVTVVR